MKAVFLCEMCTFQVRKNRKRHSNQSHFSHQTRNPCRRCILCWKLKPKPYLKLIDADFSLDCRYLRCLYKLLDLSARQKKNSICSYMLAAIGVLATVWQAFILNVGDFEQILPITKDYLIKSPQKEIEVLTVTACPGQSEGLSPCRSWQWLHVQISLKDCLHAGLGRDYMPHGLLHVGHHISDCSLQLVYFGIAE